MMCQERHGLIIKPKGQLFHQLSLASQLCDISLGKPTLTNVVLLAGLHWLFYLALLKLCRLISLAKLEPMKEIPTLQQNTEEIIKIPSLLAI